MAPSADPPQTADAARLASELRALFRELKRQMREHSDAGDLPPSQSSVILRLDRAGTATVSALARAEGVRPQSMRATVGALEASGHVAGRPDPKDGRQTILSLTPACRRWIDEGRAARQDWLTRRIGAEFSAGEVERINEAALLLRRLFGE